MAKLSDTQIILLSTASQRADGNLLPPADSVREAGARIRKSVAALLKRGFAEEVEVTAPDRTWREENERRIGLVITSAGRGAIGVEPDAPGAAGDRVELGGAAQHPPSLPGGDDATAASEPPTMIGAAVARAGSKQALVIEILGRQGGATLAELVEATGWLPHTTRAALTGLRKKGHSLTKSKRGDVTCYSITEAR
jgi:hypothetical protein